jgi:hypothetical protein
MFKHKRTLGREVGEFCTECAGVQRRSASAHNRHQDNNNRFLVLCPINPPLQHSELTLQSVRRNAIPRAARHENTPYVSASMLHTTQCYGKILCHRVVSVV